GLGGLEGADPESVEIFLHRRDRLAEMDLNYEIAPALLLDIFRDRLDAARIGARGAVARYVPGDLVGRGCCGRRERRRGTESRYARTASITHSCVSPSFL